MSSIQSALSWSSVVPSSRVSSVSCSLFCPLCGSILSLPDVSLRISCSSSVCGYNVLLSGIPMGDDKLSISQKFSKNSQNKNENLNLTSNLSGSGAGSGSGTGTAPARALVDEKCDRCGHPEMEFYTMQMRSVDEGQTVFYNCPKCGFNKSTNN